MLISNIYGAIQNVMSDDDLGRLSSPFGHLVFTPKQLSQAIKKGGVIALRKLHKSTPKNNLQ